MRQTIARRLVESKTTIPHYQVSMSFDMASMTDVRSQVNERLASFGVKASVNDFLIKACALAIRDHKYFNSSFAGERLVMHGAINIGVAIALPEERGGGLVVATIRHADQLSVRQIAEQVKDLSAKAGFPAVRGTCRIRRSPSPIWACSSRSFHRDHQPSQQRDLGLVPQSSNPSSKRRSRPRLAHDRNPQPRPSVIDRMAARFCSP